MCSENHWRARHFGSHAVTTGLSAASRQLAGKFGPAIGPHGNPSAIACDQSICLGSRVGINSRVLSVPTGTAPDFVYNKLSYERLRNLPQGWQRIGRGSGQVSSERLLFSEMLGLGGFDSVRGYDQRLLNAAAGWFANIEVGPQPWTYPAQTSHFR